MRQYKQPSMFVCSEAVVSCRLTLLVEW